MAFDDRQRRVSPDWCDKQRDHPAAGYRTEIGYLPTSTPVPADLLVILLAAFSTLSLDRHQRKRGAEKQRRCGDSLKRGRHSGG
jgi:hypothetical protein